MRLDILNFAENGMRQSKAVLKGMTCFSICRLEWQIAMLQHMTLAFDDLLKARRQHSFDDMVSRLKALMKDQAGFCSLMLLLAILGIFTAAYVYTETRNYKEKLERVRSGHFSLLFMSPALLLLNLAIREMLYCN